MKNNMEGKVIVITGASSGLGEAAAKHLSEQGVIVVLGARRVDRIQALADEINKNGGKALAKATDVTQVEQVKDLVDAAVKKYGHIDAIINKAGLEEQVSSFTSYQKEKDILLLYTKMMKMEAFRKETCK